MGSKKGNGKKKQLRAATKKKKKAERKMATTNFTLKSCTHSKAMKVISFGKEGGLWAGAVSDWRYNPPREKMDLIVNLCGSKLDEGIRLNEAARRQLPKASFPNIYSQSYATVDIDWPDGGVPRFEPKVFLDFIRYMSSGKKVGVYCMGGHGRTGTFLIAIAYLAQVVLPQDKMEAGYLGYFRDFYCGDIVETSVQVSWLKALGVDIPLHLKPSYEMRLTPNVTYYGSGESSGHSPWCSTCKISKTFCICASTSVKKDYTPEDLKEKSDEEIDAIIKDITDNRLKHNSGSKRLFF